MQLIAAKSPEGETLNMQVRLCWRRKEGARSGVSRSAAQIVARVRGNDWEGTLRAKVARDRDGGATHLLIVQREGTAISQAALVPLEAVVPIWCAQRDRSDALIQAGRLGRRRKNHAMNGVSPTLWLRDDDAPEVAQALWSYPGVRDVAGTTELPAVVVAPTADPQELEDRVRAIRLAYRRAGAPPARPQGRSEPARTDRVHGDFVRDPQVKAFVLHRAGGVCESCGSGAPFKDEHGDPYLECHHVKRLADGGPDTVENAVAVCPNCHRELHHGRRRRKLVEALYARVPMLVRHA